MIYTHTDTRCKLTTADWMPLLGKREKVRKQRKRSYSLEP